MIQHTKFDKHLVTGGAGFIGSHVVDRLMASGKSVTVYDNLVSGKKRWIERYFGTSSFKFVEADLLDFETLKRSIRGQDVVWHLGANTDNIEGNRVTDLDLKNCTIATHNVLEAMKQSEVGRILFPSSGTVYGDAPAMDLTETFGPLLPICLYGAAKLACEGLISAYCHLFGLRAWIFRYANVVGGRMGHGVTYQLIQKLKKNPKELEILGDGNQVKPYFLVEDCIEGMLVAFNRSDKQCDVYNLGPDSVTKVETVAKIVVEEMGLKNVKFKYTGTRRGWPGDVPEMHFGVNKMKQLGWATSHTSDQAIRAAAKRLIAEESES